MRMAMEADANAGMEDIASSGNIAHQATSNAGEKQSKQVMPWPWHLCTCCLPDLYTCHMRGQTGDG